MHNIHRILDLVPNFLLKLQQTSGGPAIEDWELPARFARKPIDPLEAEYINNGGIPNWNGSRNTA